MNSRNHLEQRIQPLIATTYNPALIEPLRTHFAGFEVRGRLRRFMASHCKLDQNFRGERMTKVLSAHVA
jgi:hypothetical protein